MKRLLAGTLAAALALGLTGCGQQQEECDAKPVIYLYPEQQTEVEAVRSGSEESIFTILSASSAG